MNRLIQDLLDASSIEAGQLSVERRPEAIEPILHRATAMFERQASERAESAFRLRSGDRADKSGAEEEK
jgi:signal transduction histidine kinase